MIPLESPVPEIGTPGSESGGRKRAHGPRIAARCESAGSATDALPATRLPSTLPSGTYPLGAVMVTGLSAVMGGYDSYRNGQSGARF